MGNPLVTNEMKASIGEFFIEVTEACYECYDIGADKNCEYCGGTLEYIRKIPVPWDIEKAIYKAMAKVAIRK